MLVIEHGQAYVVSLPGALHLVLEMRNDAPVYQFIDIASTASQTSGISLDHAEGNAIGLSETHVTKTVTKNASGNQHTITVLVIETVRSEGPHDGYVHAS